MKSFQILIKGIVQGVGFRPNIIKQATQNGNFVEISNSMEGVELIFNANSLEYANLFWNTIQKNLPPKAIVTESFIQEIEFRKIEKHHITKQNSGVSSTKITPEMAWCSSCKTEFFDRNNRRFQFPFIACTDCGSRFSVMKSLPFERENTTHHWSQCNTCEAEYQDFMGNKRAFSQLNSCESCNFPTFIGAKMGTFSKQLLYLKNKLQNGEMLAIKGIAGYLFVLDFSNKWAIQNLRNLKNRPQKPFALMVENIEFAHQFFYISTKEQEALESSAAPIVIVQPKQEFLQICDIQALSGFSQKVGVMLASSGFLYQICNANQGAVVATSGNISGFPLEFQDEKALKHFANYQASVWHYEREIIFPQDDSVMQFSPYFQQKIILRRARGLSPSEIYLPKYKTQKCILALGAEMKSTIALAYDEQLLISPYLGKLSTIENIEHWKYYIQQMLQLTQITPEIVLIDKHPQFQYRAFIAEIPELQKANIVEIQHHEAHFAAVLGENNLLESNEKILGVIADGMGYGENNEICGGEFFIFENQKIQKTSQFPTFYYLLGDRMSLEPRLAYFSIKNGEIPLEFQQHFLANEIQNWKTILPNQPKTTSLGRVFDALAFVLAYPPKKQSFEGEATLFLEKIFEKAYHKFGLDFEEHYFEYNTNWQKIFEKIELDILENIENERIVWKFLHTIICFIEEERKKMSCQKLAFSGGVFQNKYLVDLLIYYCKKNQIEIIFHNYFSPNDENISLGQMFHYQYLKSEF